MLSETSTASTRVRSTGTPAACTGLASVRTAATTQIASRNPIVPPSTQALSLYPIDYLGAGAEAFWQAGYVTCPGRAKEKRRTRFAPAASAGSVGRLP